jgi:hypothetical protein
MPQFLDTPRYPFALGRCLDQNLSTTVLDILQRARGEKLDHFDHLRILLSKKLEPRASRDLNQIWMNTNWIPKRNGGCITILK